MNPAMIFPDINDLPPVANLPDPLRMLDGTLVKTREEWEDRRKPELQALFQHYMYGFMPPAPETTAVVRSVNRECLGGKATLKQISIAVGPPGCPAIELMLIIPNNHPSPPPVFLGLNFAGNHTVLADPAINLPRGWVPGGLGSVNYRASEAGRGQAASHWAVDRIIERGYALATCYAGDVAPDKPDFTGGVFPFWPGHGPDGDAPTAWGLLAAWAWGLQRAVDYLMTDKDIAAEKIILFGHSRNGKAALLSAAFDPRPAAVIPHQAGCGGSAPSRCHNPAAETVTIINDHFPHWFNDIFPQFNGREDRLPFDQHCLVALCAPRPVLFTCGSQDQWADPPGQFEALQAARPVYQLYGIDPIPAGQPLPGVRVGRELSYYLRDAPHMVDGAYWDVFMDFADAVMEELKA